MDFKMTLETNKEIMRLIRGKYPNEFPLGHNTPESRYYELLRRDTADAERALSHAGKK